MWHSTNPTQAPAGAREMGGSSSFSWEADPTLPSKKGAPSKKRKKTHPHSAFSAPTKRCPPSFCWGGATQKLECRWKETNGKPGKIGRCRLRQAEALVWRCRYTTNSSHQARAASQLAAKSGPEKGFLCKSPIKSHENNSPKNTHT